MKRMPQPSPLGLQKLDYIGLSGGDLGFGGLGVQIWDFGFRV